MASELDIINGALVKLGAQPILAITDPSPEGRLANRTYGDLRDDLLRDYNWNFAVREFELAASATAPLYEFTYRYVLPDDFLRLVDLNNPQSRDYRIEYSSEGLCLLTNIEPPLQGRYVWKVTNAGLFDPKFRDALSAKLAMEWAEALTSSESLQTRMARLYDQKIRDAKVVDGQDNTGRKVNDSNAWIDARY